MIRVTSEIGRLRRVVVQPPGIAHERMLPRHIDPTSPDYLLFDDLIHVPTARDEHAQLQAVLGVVAEVVEFEDLLREALEEPEVRADVIEQIGIHYDLHGSQRAVLESLDAAELAPTLIVGTVGGGLDAVELFPPIPNLIFTRDLAAVLGDLVVVGNARKPARWREAVLAWAVADHHPLFAGNEVAAISRWIRMRGGSAPLTVEGGDVLCLSDSVALVGASERTSWSMILQLARELFDHGFSSVLVVEMPKQRSSMHLDTVFTVLDHRTCAVFPNILETGGPEEVEVVHLRRAASGVEVEEFDGDLLQALASVGFSMEPVLCGGGHPVHAVREQWTDGANYVALAPGVVVGYARNEHTAAAMVGVGFEVLSVREFLDLLRRDFHDDPDALLASGRRYAVHIVGHELSRGRGGPRCLTLPLLRDPPGEGMP
ncbi:MAG: arginine deiminase [Deltaproteobacteria bacterium]|nr:MAG: arginine deiminase [Deltaproteobacteria bacterium]